MAEFKKVILRWPGSVPIDQINQQFFQGMLDRMAVGFHTYGHVLRETNRPDNLANIDVRVKKYKATGNTEFLMDAANFAMMEFMRPTVKDAYFKPTDKRDSPGSVVEVNKRKKRVKGKEEY